MAIDDNTLYGLTGAQVKELPERIEAVKGLARELTTDDYNWPVSNPTSVALWLLEPGTYCKNDANIVVRYGTTSASGGSESLVTFIVDKNNTVAHTLAYRATSSGSMFLKSVVTDVASGAVLREFNLNEVNNTLTSTSVEQPLSAKQGKVLKDLIDSIAIRGAGAPTTSTVGQVGTLYEDTTNGDLYICTDATNPYVWEEVGGSSVNVVQSPGTSRTDVMSQYAATKLVYPDYSSTVLKAIRITGSTSSGAHSEEVTIGYGVSANAGRAAVGVGYQANNNGNRSVAIGNYARATADGSIAIGEGAYASTRGEMNIGTSTSASYGTSYGYNNSNYRLLTGLYDPQNAHDAATKGYVDTAIAGGGVSAFTTNEWNALWA